MEWKSVTDRVIAFLKKYRYAALVLILGLVLMLIPTGNQNSASTEDMPAETQAEPTMEQRLEAILSQIEGAGKVKVMLSTASGEQILYQTNDDILTGTDSSTIRQDTVTVSDAQRNESGLVKQVLPPTYLGAIILCQGGDSASIRLAITDAVSKITGLGANQISVLKMK